MQMRDRFISLLMRFKSNQLPFHVFATELNTLIEDDLLKEFSGYEESRIRDFLWYFNSVDPLAQPCRNLRDRLAMSLKRVCGDPAYPIAQLIEEAQSLERCLMGKEAQWERICRYLSPFR